MNKIPADVTIFAAPDDGDAEEEARIFRKFHGLTSEDIKYYRSEGQLLMRTKREVLLKGDSSFIDEINRRKRLN